MIVKRSISKDNRFDNLTVEIDVPGGTVQQIEHIGMELEMAIRNALRIPIPPQAAPQSGPPSPMGMFAPEPPVPWQHRVENARTQAELTALWASLAPADQKQASAAFTAKSAAIGGV